jgi:hypothetical protein
MSKLIAVFLILMILPMSILVFFFIGKRTTPPVNHIIIEHNHSLVFPDPPYIIPI